MKKLNEMTTSELKALFEQGTVLNEMVEKKAVDYMDSMYKDEDLYGICYEYRGGNFTFLSEYHELPDLLERTQEAHEFFPAVFFEDTVQKFIDLVKREEVVGWTLRMDNYEKLSGRIERLKHDIESYLSARMDRDFAWCATADAFAEYILEMDTDGDFDDLYVEGNRIFREVA